MNRGMIYFTIAATCSILDTAHSIYIRSKIAKLESKKITEKYSDIKK